MGRRETVMYVCDWCGVEAPPNLSDYVELPVGWVFLSEVDDCLCAGCWRAREVAIAAAKTECAGGPPRDAAREELRFIKAYLGHQDQDADHAFLVRRIDAVLAGRDPSPIVTAALAAMQNNDGQNENSDTKGTNE